MDLRTEILTSRSVGLPARGIGDYNAARRSQVAHIEAINGNQPGDPELQTLRANLENNRELSLSTDLRP